MLADKDAEGILSALAGAAHSFVVTQSSSPRAMGTDVLEALAIEILGDDRVVAVDRLADALDVALARADDIDPAGSGVVVTGSVVTVAEARRILRGPGAVG